MVDFYVYLMRKSFHFATPREDKKLLIVGNKISYRENSGKENKDSFPSERFSMVAI